MKAGWESKKLGEIADYFIGLTYSPKDVSTEGMIVLRSSNVQNGVIDLSDIVRVNKSIQEKLIVKDGDILMCSRNGSARLVGKTATIQASAEPMTFGTFMTVIRSQFNPYLSYFFQSELFRQQISGGENTMINQITKYMLNDVIVPFTSIAEQARLVSILDDAFEGMSIAKANAEKNLKNARELFESYLQSVFTQRGKGWMEKPLGNYCDLLNGFAFKSSDVVPESETQLVRMGNLYGNRLSLDRGAVFYPDAFATEYQRYLLREGDIVMSLTGTTGKEDYGYAVRIPECEHNLLMNQRIVKFDSIREDEIDRNYLLHFLRSRTFLDVLYPTANGTRQANLSSVTIKTLLIPICSITEQRRIASSFEVLSDEIERLEIIYTQKIKALDELKKSFLHKAFSGEL